MKLYNYINLFNKCHAKHVWDYHSVCARAEMCNRTIKTLFDGMFRKLLDQMVLKHIHSSLHTTLSL